MPKCVFCGVEIPEGRQICPICEHDELARIKEENEQIRQNNISAGAVEILLDEKDKRIKQLSDALYLMADYYACKTPHKDCAIKRDCSNRAVCVQETAVLFAERAAAIAEHARIAANFEKNHTVVTIERKKTIAVDFDGTLCVNKFPEIGAPKHDVINYVKSEQSKGRVIILWTCRKGLRLAEAISWCERQGLIFDYVNKNTAENILLYGDDTRKINADIYIDDKAADIDALIGGGYGGKQCQDIKK